MNSAALSHGLPVNFFRSPAEIVLWDNTRTMAHRGCPCFKSASIYG